MKNSLIIALLLMANSALAAQKVWLDASGKYFDPAEPTHRQFKYFELPLLREGDRYQIKLYHANGQLLLEGFTLDPEWDNRQLIGEFREWHPNGQEKASGHYIIRNQVCNCGSQYPVEHGVFTSYHPNGQLEYIREYYGGGLVDGDYEEFDAEGRLIRQYSIASFKYDGVYREYHEGLLINETHYRNGRQDGPQTRYDQQGIKLYERFYKDGFQFGPQREFYQNGQLQSAYVASRHQGKREGLETIYRVDGSLERRIQRVLDEQGREVEYLEERFHKNGQLSHREQRKGQTRLSEGFNEEGDRTSRSEQDARGRQGLNVHTLWNGTLKEHYRNNVKHGPYLMEYTDGSSTQGHFEQGHKVGTWVTVQADGSRVKEQYQAGMLHGLREEYDAQGNRIRFAGYHQGQRHGQVDEITYRGWEIGTYHHGKLHGEYRLLTEDGRLLHQGRYHNGEPDGVHYQFADNGRLISRSSYRQGVPHGDWIETNYDGALVRKTTYDQGQVKTEVILDSGYGDSTLLWP